jgi:phosphate starvation-inducible PhoH-like protein
MGKQKNKLPGYYQESLVKNFEPKTKKQEEFIKLIDEKEIVICKGSSGSGKTFVSLAKALDLLGNDYKQIILVKSLVTVPEEATGFIPGDIEKKMDPYMMNFTWNIDKICGEGSAKSLMDKKLIKVLPIAFARGISIDNSIVLLDESQNLSYHTFKTLITRIGDKSKYIIMGDTEQIDRKKKEESPLERIFEIFKDDPIVGTIEFTDEDCVRNPIIPKILKKLRDSGI